MKKMTPLKAIRAKCLDCSADSAAEIRRCELEDCPLWPFRMGHDPNRRGKGGSSRGRALEIVEPSPN